MRAVRGVLRVITQSKKMTAGIVILVIMILIGVFSKEICNLIGRGSDPLSIGWAKDYGQSSWKNPLGSDNYGRNILALAVTGLWTSLKVGFLAGVISTVIGIVIAFYAAYKGGVADAILRTLTDTFLVIPSLPLLIAFSGFAKRTSLLEICFILAVFAWAGAARAIRSQVLSLRTRGYVDLARITKENTFEIITFEMMPNMLPYLALGLAAAMTGSMLALASLEVIGLAPSGIQDLGWMVYQAIAGGAFTLGQWPMFVAPIIAVTLVFGALNMINIGLDEVYNPKLRKVAGA